MSQSFFITAAGTHIGKTLVTTTLCWQLKARGHSITALKPIISGFDSSDMENDSAQILRSCSLVPTPQMMKSISPWQFSAPLAPNLASEKERSFIVFDEVVEFCEEHAGMQTDIVLVEGVGGIMAPLDDRHTVLDWAAELRWPTVVVGGSYLGAISHVLTTLEVLRTRRIPVCALVLSESEQSVASLDETAAALTPFISADVPMVKLPRIRAKQEKWKHAPNISWICADPKEAAKHET